MNLFFIIGFSILYGRFYISEGLLSSDIFYHWLKAFFKIIFRNGKKREERKNSQ